MLKPEFDREQLRTFNKKGYRSVAARYAQSAELMLTELEEKINNPTCHRGHSHLPLTLWDCPTCVENERKEFKAEVERFKEEPIYCTECLARVSETLEAGGEG